MDTAFIFRAYFELNKKVTDFERAPHSFVACVTLNDRDIEVIIGWRQDDQEASCDGSTPHQVKRSLSF